MGLFDFRNKNRKAASLCDKADLVKNYADNTSAILSDYFEENRYNAAKFYEAWSQADKSQKVIVVNEIEVEQYCPEEEEVMDAFWKKITEIDNRIQRFCREECDKSELDEKSFVVDLNWVLLEGENITLGYCGRFVNIELRATSNAHMDITEIYYQ